MDTKNNKNNITPKAKEAFDNAVTAYSDWVKAFANKDVLNADHHYRQFLKFTEKAFRENHPFVKLMVETYGIEFNNKNLEQKEFPILASFVNERERKPSFPLPFFLYKEKFLADEKNEKNKVFEKEKDTKRYRRS